MQTIHILKDARSLISTPDNWIQGKAILGNRWCAAGAVIEIARRNQVEDYREAIEVLDSVCPILTGILRPAARFNDEHAHEEILEMFDLAISKLEASLSPISVG